MMLYLYYLRPPNTASLIAGRSILTTCFTLWARRESVTWATSEMIDAARAGDAEPSTSHDVD
jgi:hypothetical protein